MPFARRTGRRHHATRVAVAATVLVIAVYAASAAAFNILVVHRLTSEADARLSQSLTQIAISDLGATAARSPAGDSDHDLDDAPRFLWVVDGAGSAVALTPGAPALPRRTWAAGATTVSVAGSPFRFDATRSGDGWLIAGESLAQLSRVQAALIPPELIFGMVLLLVTFFGSLVIGLRASAPLETVHRRQVEFTADASHELRTPLSVIEAEVGLALSRPRTAHEYEAVLRRIAGEGHRLRRIVDDLLWLARIDDEQATVPPGVQVDVAAVAAASAMRFAPIASATGVLLSIDAPLTGSTVVAEASWIDRLVGVLVDNAIKYSGSGGRVHLAVRCLAGRVVLTVDDSGPGIPVEQRSTVLDRFHRGTEGPEGSGLGLAIADSVVRATHGAWLIADAPLGGARMEVSWKRAGSGHSLSHPGDRDGAGAQRAGLTAEREEPDGSPEREPTSAERAELAADRRT